MVICSQEKSCDNLLTTAFLVFSKGNIRIRSHLASEYFDKPLADFVIINLKMVGHLLNPHSQDESEFRKNGNYYHCYRIITFHQLNSVLVKKTEFDSIVHYDDFI